ncbi:alpha/beta hydrolase [Actinoplanes sp. NPDC049596]|uniref:alpha/beta hydrolase n=1 Tax=unclassified Actinoplanes TaxID=2626549 RepID=UPI0034394B88
MRFTSDTSADGIRERDFTVGDVPGVLWSPAGADSPTPLILMGHGGGNHKKSPAMTGRAELLIKAGCSVAVLDAPGHGDRPRTAHDDHEIAALFAARAAGAPEGPIVVRYNLHLAEQAVPEWQRTLDALDKTIEFTQVGYFGLNMATATGIPLIARDPRITAAVLGQFWPAPTLLEAARRITIPIEFALQWHDEHIPRQDGLALFDAFASPEKTLHANAGTHKQLPRFESRSAVHFFTRHLKTL